MKTNELRVDNWVEITSNEGNEYIQCNVNTIKMVERGLDFIIPIPLTEEWLLKFGFKKIDKYTFVRGGFFIHKRKDGIIFNIGKKKIYLEFVHTLQNMYFCIEQKELV